MTVNECLIAVVCTCREHFEGAGELRILLCQPKVKQPGEKPTSTVLAACGIYMKDILDAVPIDKYFELFKPGEGADGGFIRISMNYLKPDQVRNPGSLLQQSSPKKGGLVPKLVLGAVLVAGGVLVSRMAVESNKKKEKEEEKSDEKGGLWKKK